MQETLKEILIELKSINKKLDALTPSLNVNEIEDRLTETVQNELLQTTIHDTSKKEIDYLREVADKEAIAAFKGDEKAKIVDPINLYHICKKQGLSDEEIKIKLCDEFIKDIGNLKGMELAPHLIKVVPIKENRAFEFTLSFALHNLRPYFIRTINGLDITIF